MRPLRAPPQTTPPRRPHPAPLAGCSPTLRGSGAPPRGDVAWTPLSPTQLSEQGGQAPIVSFVVALAAGEVDAAAEEHGKDDDDEDDGEGEERVDLHLLVGVSTAWDGGVSAQAAVGARLHTSAGGCLQEVGVGVRLTVPFPCPRAYGVPSPTFLHHNVSLSCWLVFLNCCAFCCICSVLSTRRSIFSPRSIIKSMF